MADTVEGTAVVTAAAMVAAMAADMAAVEATTRTTADLRGTTATTEVMVASDLLVVAAAMTGTEMTEAATSLVGMIATATDGMTGGMTGETTVVITVATTGAMTGVTIAETRLVTTGGMFPRPPVIKQKAGYDNTSSQTAK